MRNYSGTNSNAEEQNDKKKKLYKGKKKPTVLIKKTKFTLQN